MRVLLRYLGERSYDNFRAAAKASGVRLRRQDRSANYRPLTEEQAKALILCYRSRSRAR